jgi:hypothetical protein
LQWSSSNFWVLTDIKKICILPRTILSNIVQVTYVNWMRISIRNCMDMQTTIEVMNVWPNIRYLCSLRWMS